MVGTLARMEDRTVECFRTGNGIAPTEYERLKEHMADETSTSLQEALAWNAELGTKIGRTMPWPR